jgi:hypothetical protein
MTDNEKHEIYTEDTIAEYRAGYTERGSEYNDEEKPDIEEFMESGDRGVLMEKKDTLMLVMKHGSRPDLVDTNLSNFQDYFGIQISTAEGKTTLQLSSPALSDAEKSVEITTDEQGMIGIKTEKGFVEIQDRLAEIQDKVVGHALAEDRVIVGGTEVHYLLPGSKEKTTMKIPRQWQGRLSENGGKIDVPDETPEFGNSFIEMAGAPTRFVLRKEGKEGYHALEGTNPLETARAFMLGEKEAAESLIHSVGLIDRSHEVTFSHYSSDGRVCVKIDNLKGEKGENMHIDLSLSSNNARIQSAILWEEGEGSSTHRQSIVPSGDVTTAYSMVYDVLLGNLDRVFGEGVGYQFTPEGGGAAVTLMFKGSKFSGKDKNGKEVSDLECSTRNGRPSVRTDDGTIYYLNQPVTHGGDTLSFAGKVDIHERQAMIREGVNTGGTMFNISRVLDIDGTWEYSRQIPQFEYYNSIPGQNGVVYIFRQKWSGNNRTDNSRYRPEDSPVYMLKTGADGRIALGEDEKPPTIAPFQAFADIMVYELSTATASREEGHWTPPEASHMFLLRNERLKGADVKAVDCKYQIVDGTLYAKGNDGTIYEGSFAENAWSFKKMENVPASFMNVGEQFTALLGSTEERGNRFNVDEGGNFKPQATMDDKGVVSADAWQRVLIGGEDYACIRVKKGEGEAKNIVWKGDNYYVLKATKTEDGVFEYELQEDQSGSKDEKLLEKGIPIPPAHIATDAGPETPDKKDRPTEVEPIKEPEPEPKPETGSGVNPEAAKLLSNPDYTKTPFDQLLLDLASPTPSNRDRLVAEIVRRNGFTFRYRPMPTHTLGGWEW